MNTNNFNLRTTWTIQFFNPKVFVAGGDGDDDINDVAAMGGVNLAEEANVSPNSSNHPKVRPDTYFFTSEYSRCY